MAIIKKNFQKKMEFSIKPRNYQILYTKIVKKNLKITKTMKLAMIIVLQVLIIMMSLIVKKF